MPLVTLEEIRGLLLIPASDLSRDAGLQLVLDAVEAAFLDDSGYSLTAGSRTDILHNVRVGIPTPLPKRPVDMTTPPIVEGRRYMAVPVTWTPLSGDIPDPTTGLLVVMGSGDFPIYEGSDSFPPQTGPSRFFRWRSQRWPLVRVQYAVTSIVENPPREIASALAQIAASYSSRILGSGGNLQSVTALGVSETYFAPNMVGNLPAGVGAVLTLHRRNQGARLIV